MSITPEQAAYLREIESTGYPPRDDRQHQPPAGMFDGDSRMQWWVTDEGRRALAEHLPDGWRVERGERYDVYTGHTLRVTVNVDAVDSDELGFVDIDGQPFWQSAAKAVASVERLLDLMKWLRDRAKLAADAAYFQPGSVVGAELTERLRDDIDAVFVNPMHVVMSLPGVVECDMQRDAFGDEVHVSYRGAPEPDTVRAVLLERCPSEGFLVERMPEPRRKSR